MMKAVMYHYVRSGTGEFPFFRYLHVDDFQAQLDHLEAAYGFLSKRDFFRCLEDGQPRDGVVLTFDDGLLDHFDPVLPILQARGLWGMFYVATSPYTTGRILDVHRVHLLLGRCGGTVLLQALRSLLTSEMLTHASVAEFRRDTYPQQDDDQDAVEFKRILNYYVAEDRRPAILEELTRLFLGSEAGLFERTYATGDQLRQLHRAGMLIGGHTVSHPVLSKLDTAQQEREIGASLEYLRGLIPDGIESFAYPYGGLHTFDRSTQAIVARSGCRFSFAVDSRDIEPRDLSGQPHALPRYDCNLFPHGAARMG